LQVLPGFGLRIEAIVPRERWPFCVGHDGAIRRDSRATVAILAHQTAPHRDAAVADPRTDPLLVVALSLVVRVRT